MVELTEKRIKFINDSIVNVNNDIEELEHMLAMQNNALMQLQSDIALTEAKIAEKKLSIKDVQVIDIVQTVK